MSKVLDAQIKLLKETVKRHERRIRALEVVITMWTTGKVEIQGVLHLLECSKRENEKNACNCGAIPVGSARSQGKGSDHE